MARLSISLLILAALVLIAVSVKTSKSKQTRQPAQKYLKPKDLSSSKQLKQIRKVGTPRPIPGSSETKFSKYKKYQPASEQELPEIKASYKTESPKPEEHGDSGEQNLKLEKVEEPYIVATVKPTKFTKFGGADELEVELKINDESSNAFKTKRAKLQRFGRFARQELKEELASLLHSWQQPESYDCAKCCDSCQCPVSVSDCPVISICPSDSPEQLSEEDIGDDGNKEYDLKGDIEDADFEAEIELPDLEDEVEERLRNEIEEFEDEVEEALEVNNEDVL